MKTKNVWAMLLTVVSFALVGTSCSSDFTSPTDAALAVTASDEAQAATLNDEVVSEADQYVTTTASTGYMAVKAIETTAVPTITVDKPDSINFPKVITIDFGTTGFTGKRGNVLKGKLIIVVTDKLWRANSSKTITFDNFFVNDNKISGSKTVSYKGVNNSNHPYWTINVSDTITRADGTTIVWNSDRTRERINNNGTPLIVYDDEYSITGSSSGINAKGVAYTMAIDASNPLLIYNNYPHFVQGSVTISSDKRTAVLDYGDGTKDNKATVTINGVTKNITLKN